MLHHSRKGLIPESDPRVARFGHPAPAWLFPYADLMTELVCFFVVLYAFAPVLDTRIRRIQGVVERGGLPIASRITKEGLVFVLEGKIGDAPLFASGSDALTPAMQSLLEKLAPKLRTAARDGFQIQVQGHTDDLPVYNEDFHSNWELSSARATAALEFLASLGVPEGHLFSSGHAEFQPVCRTTSPECRAKNRRLVLLIRNPPDEGKGN